MKKTIMRALALCMAILLSPALLVSCSEPPELDTVRETFISLIQGSVEVNEIFFGEGLPTYPRLEGDGDLKYDEASGAYYSFISVGERIILKYKLKDGDWQYAEKTAEAAEGEPLFKDDEGCFYYPTDFDDTGYEYVYDDNSPQNYDYVRHDCKYQSIDEIMALAESVYSSSYLKGEKWKEGNLGYGGVYAAMFDGLTLGTEISYARYRTDDSADGFFLLKSNEFEPYFTTHKTYDYSTMKIIKPSRANLVNIEITANGRYIDYESFNITTGEHTVTLTFILENGEWRLDTPTY